MLPAHVRIRLCTEPQDFRKSFDGLARVTREILHENPQSGAIFAFFNKRMNRIKLLWWDESGYCLLYKRLHRAIVRVPVGASTTGCGMQIDAPALLQILRGASKDKSYRRRRIAA